MQRSRDGSAGHQGCSFIRVCRGISSCSNLGDEPEDEFDLDYDPLWD